MSEQLRHLIEKQQQGDEFTLEVIAKEADVPVQKLEQLLNNQTATATLATVERLLRYFQLSDINELITYVPDKQN